MEFIKGKWYKGLGYAESYIAKFDYLKDKKFYFTECISPLTGSRGGYVNKEIAYLEIHGNITECPLSEIQQYLPDRHPDKFVNKSETSPLPEKWYLEVTKSNLSYVSSKSPWSFNSMGYIHSCLNSNIGKYWFHNNKPLKEYTEITLEQFKEYVVKDVTSKKVEPEIPEYVECVKSWSGSNQKSTIGKIYVTSIEPYFSTYDWKNVLKKSGYFKPSNKQAFDTQNKPKEQSIEEILEICKKKYPIGTTFRDGDREYTVEKELIIQYNSCISHIGTGCVWYDGKYAEIISLPEPIKYPDSLFKDFGVHIHKGNYVGYIDPYQQELERVIWSNTMSIHRETNKGIGSAHKSNDLEFQYPVINVRNKKKSKLIIINQ
jgi:hypothetical protein